MENNYNVLLKALTYETLHSYFVLSSIRNFMKKLKQNDLMFLIISNSLIRKLIFTINDEEIVTKSFHEALCDITAFIAEWIRSDSDMRQHFNEDKFLNTLADLDMILTDYKAIKEISDDFEENTSFGNFKDLNTLFKQ